ncbi:phosphatase PAP2 family protein [Ureibacillus sp. FSL W8-0352]|uniref:phosphatase PAP2 family protein n=1 Tax=Ureibacillus sp. FSL W8-0352 TaxID=2954596 RepID=UPI0030FA9A27
MELLLKGNKFFSFFHYFGEISLIDLIAIIVLFILWLKFKNYRGMLFVILTIPIGRLINHFVKEWVARPRPEIADQMASYSFPSGHAMMGLLYLFTIAYLLSELTKNHKSKLWYWIGGLVLAILTGLSRVAEKNHFATAVMAGV